MERETSAETACGPYTVLVIADLKAVIPDLKAVIPDLKAVIPDLQAVIQDLKAVIPDLIRDPVPHETWIAGQARNDNFGAQ